MKKPHWTKQIQKCSEMIPRMIVDQEAETCREMAEASGVNRDAINQICAANIKAGRWERVWKRVDGRTVPAYRVKR